MTKRDRRNAKTLRNASINALAMWQAIQNNPMEMAETFSVARFGNDRLMLTMDSADKSTTFRASLVHKRNAWHLDKVTPARLTVPQLGGAVVLVKNAILKIQTDSASDLRLPTRKQTVHHPLWFHVFDYCHLS